MGKWQTIDVTGVASALFTISSDHEARKHHSLQTRGRWELVGREIQITWTDGWSDVFRIENGMVYKIALERGKTWKDPPTNVEAAERLP